MPQVRGTFAELADHTDRTIFALLGKEYKALNPIWRQIYDVKTSGKRSELMTGVTGMGDAQEKPEGGAFAGDGRQSSIIPRPGRVRSRNDMGQASKPSRNKDSEQVEHPSDALRARYAWQASRAGKHILPMRAVSRYRVVFMVASCPSESVPLRARVPFDPCSLLSAVEQLRVGFGVK